MVQESQWCASLTDYLKRQTINKATLGSKIFKNIIDLLSLVAVKDKRAYLKNSMKEKP